MVAHDVQRILTAHGAHVTRCTLYGVAFYWPDSPTAQRYIAPSADGFSETCNAKPFARYRALGDVALYAMRRGAACDAKARSAGKSRARQ